MAAIIICQKVLMPYQNIVSIMCIVRPRRVEKKNTYKQKNGAK